MHFYLFSNMIMWILVILCVLLCAAFIVLFERKILSLTHYRKGPNKVNIIGIMQPFSDAMKLLTKEFSSPLKTNFILYTFAPMFLLSLSLIIWMIYPFHYNLFNLPLNSMFFFCVISMGVYGLIMCGWASNSSFSMIGSIRSVAQSISYEVIFTIALLISLFFFNSLNFMTSPKFQKFSWLFFMMYPSSMILMFSMLAEINRTPFDLSEGESELVSGFNIEYGSVTFTLIFLAEYIMITLMMYVFNLMFMCMSLTNLLFYINFFFMLFFVIWTRSTLPRIRYDYLMYLCWMILLPLIILNFMFYMFFLKYPMDMILL